MKLRLLGLSLKENGLLWTTLMGVYYATSAVAERAFSTAASVRQDRGLPGMNSAAMNKLIWDRWDWSAEGEEWTQSPEWKASVIEKLLTPNVVEGDIVLEIGPGGGRWTTHLQRRAKKITAIDISEKCLNECRKKFAHCNNIEFALGSGSDLDPIPSSSIDSIWSFDVFVHINRAQLRTYALEFSRVLKPGGRGVIQHGSVAGARGGWRSDVTNADVADLLVAAELEVVDQISSWWDKGVEHRAGLYDDTVTIFRKPASS